MAYSYNNSVMFSINVKYHKASIASMSVLLHIMHEIVAAVDFSCCQDDKSSPWVLIANN